MGSGEDEDSGESSREDEGGELFRRGAPIIGGGKNLRQTMIDDRLAKGWMREVKQYDPTRRSFRSWLLEAELRMETTWDLETRLNYLRAKMGLSEVVRMEQVLQIMESHRIPKTWQAFKERALLVFPGATDPDIAEFQLNDQKQNEGETFTAWVDRMTQQYIDTMGRMPQMDTLGGLIYKGLRIPYKIRWKKKPPENLLDAIASFPKWEAEKWQDLGLPNPTEGTAQVQYAHPVPEEGIPVHPARAGLLQEHKTAVLLAQGESAD